MKLPEASFGPLLRPPLGGFLPSWLRVGCWALCKQGLFLQNPPSSHTRTRLEKLSGRGDHPKCSLPSWLRVGCWGLCKQGLFLPNHPSPEGEHVWSGFQATETTRQAAVPTEPEAPQDLLGPMRSIGPGEN